ncbi:MAG: hypothetical protein HQ546_07770 [Planctomycetes bacterium]|nr:hypothetical protein [Planctomycetota bacterium]
MGYGIYFMFAFWLFAIVFAARGALAMWGGIIKPKTVAWAILPGTLVAEMACALGCLLTGAQVRLRRLTDVPQDKPDKALDAKNGIPYLTPLLTGLLPLVACIGLIGLLSAGLGRPVFADLYMGQIDAPRDVPYLSNATVWTMLNDQVWILDGHSRALTALLKGWPWQNWRAWLFEYLMICLVLCMAPIRRPLRPTLVAVAVVAFVGAAAVAIFSAEAMWLRRLWPLLSYTWATALLVLTVTLCVRGAVGLVRILLGKESAGK